MSRGAAGCQSRVAGGDVRILAALARPSLHATDFIAVIVGMAVAALAAPRFRRLMVPTVFHELSSLTPAP